MLIGVVVFISWYVWFAGVGLGMMAMDWPLLSLTTFVPLIGAFAILLIRGTEGEVARNARWVALFTSLVTLLISTLSGLALIPQPRRFNFKKT